MSLICDGPFLVRCAELASDSYFGVEAFRAACFGRGYTVDKVVCYRRGLCAFLVSRDGYRYLVVRGTDDVEDAIDDIKCNRNYCPQTTGFTHRGFRIQSDRLWREIQIDLYARDKGLVLLGHSLGGSIAMHIAVNIAEYRKSQGLSKPVVVTFGTPLTGTSKWCHWLSEHTELYRVTNDNDPICRVPCWPLYQHPIGVSIHFRDSGPVLNPGFRDRLTNSYRGVFGTACRFARSVFSGRGIRGGFVDAMSIDDHRIMSYLNVASRYSDGVSSLIAGVKIR